jgi:hypothetical protein
MSVDIDKWFAQSRKAAYIETVYDWIIGRMVIAPSWKGGDRKVVQVRVLCDPPVEA